MLYGTRDCARCVCGGDSQHESLCSRHHSDQNTINPASCCLNSQTAQRPLWAHRRRGWSTLLICSIDALRWPNLGRSIVLVMPGITKTRNSSEIPSDHQMVDDAFHLGPLQQLWQSAAHCVLDEFILQMARLRRRHVYWIPSDCRVQRERRRALFSRDKQSVALCDAYRISAHAVRDLVIMCDSRQKYVGEPHPDIIDADSHIDDKNILFRSDILT